MPTAILQLPIFARLADAERVLIAGAGGGFDIYCGIPLYLALRRLGKRVHLANLTFTALDAGSGARVDRVTVRVDASALSPDDYFPERALCQWLAQAGDDTPIYAFEKTGVKPLAAAYRDLAARFDLDAIVLVDGGTDSLMRGDEAGLGTPAEDMVSLAAAMATDVDNRMLVCLGFGIDAFHGVCHAHFLEAVAALTRDGGYLGALSLTPDMPEARGYMDAVEYSLTQARGRESIVNASILSALEGAYGDVHRTSRTRGSELWINPLMSLYWCFDLDAVARRSLYLRDLADTETIWQVAAIIEGARKQWARDGAIRPRAPIPV